MLGVALAASTPEKAGTGCGRHLADWAKGSRPWGTAGGACSRPAPKDAMNAAACTEPPGGSIAPFMTSQFTALDSFRPPLL